MVELAQGWLRVGLWLRKKPSLELLKVTEISEGRVVLEGVSPEQHMVRTSIGMLNNFFYAYEYFECDECRCKPGAPTLCADCILRRTAHSRSNPPHCELPRVCKNIYAGGRISLEYPKELGPIPTRFQREWPL